jgi:hypothetical protein
MRENLKGLERIRPEKGKRNGGGGIPHVEA